MMGSAATEASANVCPRCSGTLVKDLDDDRECLQCGYVAYARLPDDVVPANGERRPNYKGFKL
jgi:ribosomal protein S27AE